MKPFYLAEITTRDNLIHQGIYHQPKHKSNTAILWVHGLTSAFYHNLTIYQKLIETGEKTGLGFAAFNNRGHDMVTGIKTVDAQSATGFGHADGGAGREVFEECILDIDAGITFLGQQGYQKVILLGHSTGAIKCSYYAGTTRDSRLGGIVLAGPMSDRLGEQKHNPKLATSVQKMVRMIQKGKGDVLMNDLMFLPVTPKRYVSLFKRGSNEDHLDYGDKMPLMRYYSDIKLPLLVILSELDDYLDRPVTEVQAVFDRYTTSPRYASVVIPGAPHSYEGKEHEFVQTVVAWVKSL